jgi:hypothetical protein
VAQNRPDSPDTTAGHKACWPHAGGGPSSWGHPQVVALRASDPPGGAEAEAEADARTEAEAPPGAVRDGVAVADAEAGGEGRLSGVVDGREPPGEQPHEAEAAWPPWYWPVSEGWQNRDS